LILTTIESMIFFSRAHLWVSEREPVLIMIPRRFSRNQKGKMETFSCHVSEPSGFDARLSPNANDPVFNQHGFDLQGTRSENRCLPPRTVVVLPKQFLYWYHDDLTSTGGGA
jgi:hypothetical protein